MVIISHKSSFFYCPVFSEKNRKHLSTPVDQFTTTLHDPISHYAEKLNCIGIPYNLTSCGQNKTSRPKLHHADADQQTKSWRQGYLISNYTQLCPHVPGGFLRGRCGDETVHGGHRRVFSTPQFSRQFLCSSSRSGRSVCKRTCTSP